jgi:hypothetical protein
LQWYNISQDIPCLRTNTHIDRTNKWIPIANLYMLWCRLQIGGTKPRQVSWCCWRKCVRENVSERTCQRASKSDCQRLPGRDSLCLSG